MNPTPTATRPPAARGGIWVVLQFGTIAVALMLGPLWGGHWDAEASVGIGRVFLIFSGVIALAGFVALGRNLTPSPKPRVGGTLVQHGIYRLVRHPLYVSLVLGCLGWGLMWQSGPATGATVFLAWALNAKARVEEAWLQERFPEYADYARRVRRFVPWIY
jgi:protein-S-isoprenylcysteine O-methyltransferase Ste14